MRLHLDVVPISEPAQSTPNAVLIYNHANRGTLLNDVQGTESTTHSPKMVNDNNHAHTHFMRCPHSYEMQLCHFMLMPCHTTHIYIEMEAIWTISFMHYTHASFGQLYQSTYNFQINHTKHVKYIHAHIHTLHMSIH